MADTVARVTRIAGVFTCIVTVMILVVTIGFIVTWCFLGFLPIRKLGRCFAFPVNSGLAFVEPTGRRMERTLPSRDGKPLEDPKFAIHGSQLFYWSRLDSSLGMVDSSRREPRWHPLGQDLSGIDWSVRRVSTDGRFVCMDVVDVRPAEEDERSVLVLDLRSGKWKKLDGVTQGRLDPSGSRQAAMRTLRGEFVVGDILESKDRRTISRIPRVRDWDYSFDTGRLYVLERIGNEIVIQNSADSIKRVKLPTPWNALTIFWQSRLGELWVCGHGAFSAFFKTPVFSGEGKYLGALHPVGPSFYVQELDCTDMQSLAARLNKPRD